MSILLNDLYILLSVSLLAVLFGMVCAFYLEEWLPKTNWIRRSVESLVAILTGIPSLFYGILAIGFSLLTLVLSKRPGFSRYLRTLRQYLFSAVPPSFTLDC